LINFKTVRFKNFGSFGNTFTEIELGKNATTLVCGSNGNGKSFAFLDSISFALFGKPFRNMNIPQLVNSINKKNCVVELEFTVGKTEYKIVRGLAPKMFKIFKDGQLLNEDAKSKDYQNILEEQIVNMNHKTFSQVVVLGSSSFIPFMQLTPADRRQVIENILDIGIFSEMNGVLKLSLIHISEPTRQP
jgi:DNA repair exonuclease SbcCD ATPase subunit